MPSADEREVLLHQHGRPWRQTYQRTLTAEYRKSVILHSPSPVHPEMYAEGPTGLPVTWSGMFPFPQSQGSFPAHNHASLTPPPGPKSSGSTNARHQHQLSGTTHARHTHRGCGRAPSQSGVSVRFPVKIKHVNHEVPQKQTLHINGTAERSSTAQAAITRGAAP